MASGASENLGTVDGRPVESIAEAMAEFDRRCDAGLAAAEKAIRDYGGGEDEIAGWLLIWRMAIAEERAALLADLTAHPEMLTATLQ